MATGDLCTLADIKLHINTTKDGDDTLISQIISEASADIHAETGIRFYPVTETRYFHAIDDIEGRELILDMPLLSVTSIDPGDGTTLDNSLDYLLEPANETAKATIILRASRSPTWTYDSDPEQAIGVTGSWGFEASTPPASAGSNGDIRRAAIMLAVHYYEIRDREGGGDVVGFQDGSFRSPRGWPPEVKRILQRKTMPNFSAVV